MDGVIIAESLKPYKRARAALYFLCLSLPSRIRLHPDSILVQCAFEFRAQSEKMQIDARFPQQSPIYVCCYPLELQTWLSWTIFLAAVAQPALPTDNSA